VDGQSTTRRWGAAHVAIAVVVVLAAALVGYSFLHETLQNSKAHGALSGYLEDVQRGDFDRAYGQLCTRALKGGGYTEADHTNFLKSQPAFLDFELDNPTTSTVGAYTEITYSVHFTMTTGVSVMRMAVDLQDNGPKVCDGPNTPRGRA
jgi:hypothetical protein